MEIKCTVQEFTELIKTVPAIQADTVNISTSKIDDTAIENLCQETNQ